MSLDGRMKDHEKNTAKLSKMSKNSSTISLAESYSTK